MSAPRRAAAITGIGLVSSLGEGAGPHLAALRGGAGPVVDAESFAPYPIHPLPEIDLRAQIPRRGDLRQMEGWQRLGVYAAGLALDSAGLKEDEAARDALEILVAAGGGERDEQVDGEIATGLLRREGEAAAAYLNEHLMNDLRPTLFLAQLSNLLAGNIAIVHGVTGGSRTFMGEEQAGVDALRVAAGRIGAGQCGAIMVGGAFNAARRDMLLLLEFGGAVRKGGFAPVFCEDRGGAILGSMGAFLVLEDEAAARARGAHVFARIDAVAADRAKRGPGAVRASLAGLIGGLGAGAGARVLSAASGAAPWAQEERAAIAAALPGAEPLATGDLIGHGLEAAFPAAAALAALLIDAGEADEAVITSAGHWRGEGAARLVRAEGGA